MTESDVPVKVKLSLGLNTADKNSLVESVIDEVKELVLNYCNIDELPEGLMNTVIRMSVELYRNEQPGSEEVPMVVTSVSLGDTSTSMSTKAYSEGYANSVIKDYKKQLNRYRKVSFT